MTSHGRSRRMMKVIAFQSDGCVSLGLNPPESTHFVTLTSTEYHHRQQNANKNGKGWNTGNLTVLGWEGAVIIHS